MKARLPELRTLSGNELAPRSLKGSLNFRFSSLPLMMILIVIGMSGDDAVLLVAIVSSDSEKLYRMTRAGPRR